MNGIVDPLTIPRVECAMKQVEDYSILTEGAKPHTEFTRA